MSTPLHERTAPGLHSHLVPLVLRLVPPPASALDLGTGTGAWAQRLAHQGYRVQAVDRDPSAFAADAKVTKGDLNDHFAESLGERFDLITATGVIEHLESPRHFLRECAKLLNDGGKLVITTPNLESAAGRLRFIVTGEWRHFGRNQNFSDPTHITPIHSFLFERIAADVGLRVTHHETYDAQVTSRGATRVIAKLLRPVMRNVHRGDNHIFVLER
jgi:2-polyprenyl-3-methyl-5-hydroxy-6-metoxy-1,4-benzoquinol methylase